MKSVRVSISAARRKLKLGFALTGNFGAPLEYDDNWAGRSPLTSTGSSEEVRMTMADC